jgi:predicted enzyme related to lactoylglutathione lyase
MRFVIVRGWDPQIGMLGLIEITEPPLSARADHRLRQGNIALVFETNDIERALAALVRLGGTVLRPLREGTNFGDLRANRIAARVVLAADPDGQYLEIFQRL